MSGHYQKDKAIKHKIVLPEYKTMNKVLKLLPKTIRLLDVACAEGFFVHLARKAGLKAYGIEIDSGKIIRARDYLGINIQVGDIFYNMDLFKKFDTFIFSRFFHNVGEFKTNELMREITRKKHFILIIRYKPGKYKETGTKRQPLATKKGLNEMLEKRGLKKKSFPNEMIVAAKGKYEPILKLLRDNIPEG